MKIITYNVNGLRAAVGKGLPEWLAQEQPDVLCLQETKLQPEQYPAEAFEALGYKAWLFSAQKKGYSGVAILSRREPDHVEYGMGIEKYDNEGRFIRADFGDLSVISVYHPSGTSGDERQAFKMEWLEDFQNYVVELQKSRPKLILCGDYNICHEPIDIHDPVRNATNSGLTGKRHIGQSFLPTVPLYVPLPLPHFPVLLRDSSHEHKQMQQQYLLKQPSLPSQFRLPVSSRCFHPQKKVFLPVSSVLYGAVPALSFP